MCVYVKQMSSLCCVNSYQILMVYLLWLYAILIVSRFLALDGKSYSIDILRFLWDELLCALRYCRRRRQPSNFSHLTFPRANRNIQTHTHTHVVMDLDKVFFSSFHSRQKLDEATMRHKPICHLYHLIFCIILSIVQKCDMNSQRTLFIII